MFANFKAKLIQSNQNLTNTFADAYLKRVDFCLFKESERETAEIFDFSKRTFQNGQHKRKKNKKREETRSHKLCWSSSCLEGKPKSKKLLISTFQQANKQTGKIIQYILSRGRKEKKSHHRQIINERDDMILLPQHRLTVKVHFAPLLTCRSPNLRGFFFSSHYYQLMYLILPVRVEQEKIIYFIQMPN